MNLAHAHSRDPMAENHEGLTLDAVEDATKSLNGSDREHVPDPGQLLGEIFLDKKRGDSLDWNSASCVIVRTTTHVTSMYQALSAGYGKMMINASSSLWMANANAHCIAALRQ